MPIERGDAEKGRELARRSATARRANRRLSPDEVEQALGPLETPADAQRQLRQLVLWGASGRIAGSVLGGLVRGVEVWLKAHAEQVDVERVVALERRIKELESELKQAGRRT